MEAIENIKTIFINGVNKVLGTGKFTYIEKDEYGILSRITMTPLWNRGSTRGDVSQVNNSNGTGTIVIPNTTPVYSYSFSLKYGTSFGIWYQAGNGSGTANMKIQLEQSYKRPGTEGSSDTAWVIGAGVADIATNLIDTTAHIQSVSPVPMKYARLKITGLGSNPADATLTAWFFQQELVA